MDYFLNEEALIIRELVKLHKTETLSYLCFCASILPEILIQFYFYLIIQVLHYTVSENIQFLRDYIISM